MAPIFAFGWSSRGRKPEYPEETHLSDLVTTWPSHMPTPCMEPGPHWWDARVLPLCQPDSRPLLISSHLCYVFHPVYPFTTFSLPVFLSLSFSLFYLKHDAHVGATCKNHFFGRPAVQPNGAGQAERLSGKSAYQLGLLKQEYFFRPICVDGPSTNTYVRPYCIIKPVAVKGACPSTHVENGSPTMENPFDRNMGCKANQGPTPGPCSPKHLSDVCENYVDKSANTSEMPSATKAPIFKWVSTSFQYLI